MIKIKKDLTGKVFGEFNDFIVLNRYDEDYIFPNGRMIPQWVVQHVCGEKFIANTQYLKQNKIFCSCMRPKCTYDLSGEYGVGYTFKKEEFWFDLEDYDKIKDYYWWYDSAGYVQAIIGGKHIRLHRLVMDVTNPSLIIDHIQHLTAKEHKIDNRKSNLRIVTSSQNNMNADRTKNNTSGVIGVCWNDLRQCWQAEIQVNKKKIFLGYFINKNEAAEARKKAEEEYFKEFAFNKSNNK